MPKGGLFIRLDLDFIDSPEIKRFSRRMQISVSEAVGMMCGVWRFAIRFRKDGILDNIHIEELAEEANYQGDPKELVQRLVECELLALTEDGKYLQVPEWESGVGFFLHQAKLNAERQRKLRESRVRNGDVTVTSRLCNGDVTVMSRPRLDPDPDPDPEAESEGDKKKRFTGSLSLPVARKKAVKNEQPTEGTEVWNAYSEAMERYHDITPPRSAATASQAKRLVGLVGLEKAKELAATFPTINSKWYREKGWAFGLMLTDYMAIMTKMTRPPSQPKNWQDDNEDVDAFFDAVLGGKG